MRKTRGAAIAAFGMSIAMLAAGCSGGDESGGSAEEGGDVSLTMWHNSTTGPGAAYWDETAAAFEAANPGVTIDIQAVQNEDMDGKLQTALNSGDSPDIFMARGGGKLADVVEANQIMDLTDLITDETRAAVGEGALQAFSIDGKVYGMPTAVLPGGFYYTEEVFEKAGITETPETFEELTAATEALKAAGIAPVALGAKDAWPAAHWYYFFAIRECSEEVVSTIAETMDFSDECWLRAGQDLEEFAATEPFNDGFLTTPAQQAANSSAGLIANKQAGMELMGAWNPGVIADLTPEKQPLEDLGWFPFPSVEGGEGDPAAMMGGVDGYSCHVDSPAECADFLNFFMQQEYQEAYAEAFVTLPASQDAQAVVTDPALQEILAAYNEAPYVTVWLDTLFGQNVGNALNGAVVEMLAGDGDAESIVTAMTDAAARG
ncbi:extracellular solute-binding protein [Cellulomonas sp. ATA003]|uniref:ABC transporter substrate-binding protein n=1 Tax=Cellulomonas sp. ATA003 TaxID=3073064 RepID=UPI00287360E8|nr:extracellular solute-binding protein [Cellulomonas sp. ATA003]WNB86885.1 extracellular solute-binding protein [Cellulomonas sp. ATA003]